ncbi:hypothetical protein AXG93_763s1120 [Marchantia polymorpha subsp. ruderalis]|uniref:Uncharacterized protein n=1 Tax=Marchantia polymorpha subsp. ruderalis TaxID=1480154 RepID=A0A176WPQ6_MARPO|nr:hypothetical protein AXG93_763s1120 [Marchantia polymorpha subsp. ruderalis]
MPRRCHYCGVIGDGRRAVGCTAAHHARRFKPYSRFGRGEAVLLLRASLDSAQLERQLERESAGQGRAGARGSRAQTKAVEVRRTDRLVQSREGGREGEQSAGGLHRLGSVWLSGWLAGRWSRSPEEHREKACPAAVDYALSRGSGGGRQGLQVRTKSSFIDRLCLLRPEVACQGQVVFAVFVSASL